MEYLLVVDGVMEDMVAAGLSQVTGHVLLYLIIILMPIDYGKLVQGDVTCYMFTMDHVWVAVTILI